MSEFRGKAIQDTGDVVVPSTQKKDELSQDKEIVKGLFAGDVNLNTVQKTLGTNWTVENAATISQWMYIGAFQIKLLEATIDAQRVCIRANAITGIILSTLTGTLSVTTLGISDSNNVYGTVTSIIFALFSFTIAIFTGYIKIYQIQETLEECIKTKQDWITFTSTITSELQLPLHLRRDALFLLIKHKDAYLDLIKRDIDISENAIRKVERVMPRPDPRFPKQTSKVACLSDVVLEVQNTVMCELIEHTPIKLPLDETPADITQESPPQIGDTVKMNQSYIAAKTVSNIRALCAKANYIGMVMGKTEDQYCIYLSDTSLEPDIICDSSAFELSPTNMLKANYSVGDIVFAYHMVDDYRNNIRGFFRASIVDKKINMVWGKPTGHTYSVRFHHDISKQYDDICEYRLRTTKPIAHMGDIMKKKDGVLCFVKDIEYKDFNWIYEVIDEYGKTTKETLIQKNTEDTKERLGVGSPVLWITDYSKFSEPWNQKEKKPPTLVQGVIIGPKDKLLVPIIRLEDAVYEERPVEKLILDQTNTTPAKFIVGNSIEYQFYDKTFISANRQKIAKGEISAFKWQSGIIDLNYKLGVRFGNTYRVKGEDNEFVTVPEILIRKKSTATPETAVPEIKVLTS
jgi:hypothetical protein